MTDDRRRLPSGTVLGDFAIIELIATGGVGQVYRAEQLSLNRRHVALKVLADEQPSARARERFRNEALALSHLQHDNLATVYAFGEHADRLFYVMRLIEGPTLATVLGVLASERERQPCLTREQRRTIVSWARDVAAALATVHAARLVHRDIKPGNIMVAAGTNWSSAKGLPDGPAALVDFGLVRFAGSDVVTKTGERALTEPYASPEQLLGAEVGSTSDVFSLGVTLHDLLSRRLPGEREAASEGLEPLRTVEAGAGADLEAILGKAADPEASWRYPHAGALHADLEAWLNGDPVSARRIERVERMHRWILRHPGSFVMRFVGGLATLAVLAVCVNLFMLARDVGGAAVDGFDAGDVRAVARAAEVLSPRVLHWLTGRADLADAVSQFKSAADGSPFARLVRDADQNDRAGLIRAASSMVAIDGPDKAPLAMNLLRSELARVAETTGVVSREEEMAREAIASAIARLALEEEATQDTEPYLSAHRRLALLIWQNDSLPQTIRLHALSALGGWGTPIEAQAISHSAAAMDEDSEEQCLALAVLERIVRRSLRYSRSGSTQALEDLDVPGLWIRHSDGLSRITRMGADAPSARAQSVSRLLLQAMLRAGQDLRLELPVDDVLTQAARGGQARADIANDAELLAAAGDVHRLAASIAAVFDDRFAENAKALGMHVGTCRDGALKDDVESRLFALRSRGLWQRRHDALFEDGYEKGWFAREGAASEWEPDPDTRLDFPRGAAVAEDLPLVESSDDAILLNCINAEWRCHDALAAWIFTKAVARRLGSARSARLVAMRTESELGAGETGYYLRGGDFARSEVRLAFTLQQQLRGVYELVIYHQRGKRDYLPWAGSAEIRVLLDDRLIADRVLLGVNTPHQARLTITSDELTPGVPHEIRLQMLDSSLATWRLMAVVVRPTLCQPPTETASTAISSSPR